MTITNAYGRSLFNIPLKRRVYFAFHYQRDLSAVNLIRTSWTRKNPAQNEGIGFFDGSLWESSLRKDPESLKSLIRDGMNNTSVVCVLAGMETYQRRWVRYEIVRGMIENKGIFTVDLDEIQRKTPSFMLHSQPRRSLLAMPPNPLSFVGLIRESQFEYKAIEIDGVNWRYFQDYTRKFSKPKFMPDINVGLCYPLSEFTARYRYLIDGADNEFPLWCQRAAFEAERFYPT